MKPFTGGTRRALLSASALLVVLLAASAAWANMPQFVVHLTDGSSANYPATQILRVELGSETLSVFTSTGVHNHPLTTVSRADFFLDPTSVRDPGESAAVIQALHLFQNRPNPFAGGTEVEFRLASAGRVLFRIFSPDGRLVRTLLDGEARAGAHVVRWDGLDDTGHKLPAGVYFYGLTASGVDEGRRMILLP